MSTSQGAPPKAAPRKAPPAAVPRAMQRQLAIAHLRASEAVMPDESASMVGSTTGSTSSWTKVTPGPVITELTPEGMPVIPEAGSAACGSQPGGKPNDPWELPEQEGGQVPPPPPVPNASSAPVPPAASAVDPATQAARNLLEGVNETSAGRRLRRQQERAARKGTDRVRWGQAPPLRSPLNFQLPPYLRQIGSGEGERSVLVLDSRDQRLQSPYQGWLLDEILVNAQAGINIHADKSLGAIAQHRISFQHVLCPDVGWPEARDLRLNVFI